jgi:2-methylcitrate dehydratase PrpD
VTQYPATPPTPAALAGFIAASRWQDIPAAVRADASRALLNFVAAALGGSQDEAIGRAAAVLGPFSGPAQATVIGRAERFDMLTAAFLNAASGNVLDFDDTHPPTVIHPTSPVAPVLLALCETERLSGAELLHALVLGIEVACRLGNAVTLQHYVRGWHSTSTCGAVGAAAAAAKALGLDTERTAWALGHGANQACGLVESLGSMAKSVSVGNAARNGLVSALLARAGYAASEKTLEGPRGFVRVLGEGPELAALTADLGSRWEAAANRLKPYPSGVVLHAVVDACLALRSRHAIDPARLRAVRARGHPLLRQRADRPHPQSGREAAVSIQHTAAVCFLHGEAGVEQYADAVVHDPAVRALGARVQVADEARIGVEAARVEVELDDGSRYDTYVEHASGSAARPMSDADLAAKVASLARWRRWPGSVEGLIAAFLDLEQAPDTAPIVRLLAA